MKTSNYPAPSGRYKLNLVKNKSWKEHSHCRIQMSLRDERYEGDKLLAILEWSSARFEKVTLVLSDTLIRYSLMYKLGISEHKAAKQTKKMAEEWLQRNYFINTFKNVNIIHRDEYLKNPSFCKNFYIIYDSYNNNYLLNQAVNTIVKDFWTHKQNSLGTYEAFAKQGIQHLLEELAAFGCMFNEKAIDLYVGRWVSDCINSIKNIEIIDTYAQAHYAEVAFIKNTDFKEV